MSTVASTGLGGPEGRELLSGDFLSFADIPQAGLPAFIKRILDLAFSLVVLVFLFPVMVAASIAVLLDSGWPIFFLQQRLGQNGRRFTVIKFRSMCKDAEKRLSEVLENNEIKDGPIFKWQKDPRITRVGRILRATSIDELPQLLNVVLGSMSLVGPRPPLESEVLAYEEWQLRRLAVKPGMTGLWQVSGRSTLGFADMVDLDLTYVETWSLWLDFRILLTTPIAVLRFKGAY